MKNIVILGGGSAGWLTALTMRQYYPQHNVTVIQSKEIGIIGVGEATTPNLVTHLCDLNINPYEVLRQTNGTFKNAIKFSNWKGDGTSYFHNFAEQEIVEDQGDIAEFLGKLSLEIIVNDFCIDDFSLSSMLSNNKKICIPKATFAIHFDAVLFARYLQKIGEERNVKVIEGDYTHAKLDERGFIRSLCLKNDLTVDCDFVFDCTGFSRLLIGKLYEQKWNSYSKHLPMKKAIPFWLDPEEKINPYTDAIAMKYGWMWKIPLTSRIGSGYVFDSDYIDENQALKEAEEYYGKKLEIRKIISFDAGRYDTLWIKNCIAIGLSATFVEPIESTSLFFTTNQLTLLKTFTDVLFDCPRSSVECYNEFCLNDMQKILDFVFLHYVTHRSDSEFWKNLRKNYVPTDTIAEILRAVREDNILKFYHISKNPFHLAFHEFSFNQVLHGLLGKDYAEKLKLRYKSTPKNKEFLLMYQKKSKDILDTYSIDHKDFITYINTSTVKNEEMQKIINLWYEEREVFNRKREFSLGKRYLT